MALSPRKLIELAKQQGRATNIPPVAVSATLLPGFDPLDPASLMEPCLLLAPCPHPVLEAMLTVSGATRTGRMSWQVGLGERFTLAPLLAVLNTHQGTIYPNPITYGDRGPRKLESFQGYLKRDAVFNLLSGTVARLERDRLHVVDHYHPQDGPARYGAITLDVTERSLYVRFITNGFTVPEHLPQVPLNLRPAGKAFIDPKPVRPIDAMPVLDWLATVGTTVLDTSEANVLAHLRAGVQRSFVVTPRRGRPAEASVSIGARVVDNNGERLQLAERGYASSTTSMTANEVAELATELAPSSVVMHPGIADVAQMASSTTVVDERLRGYQCEAVGLHLSTRLGYVNVVAPGMGKTIMTYAAMDLRAADRPRYRGLVVAEANVRAQWMSEGAEWFPQAHIVCVDSRADAPAVEAALAGPGPVVVVTSYGLLGAVSHELAVRKAAAQDAAEAVERDTFTSSDSLAEAIEAGSDAATAALIVAQVDQALTHGQVDMFDLLAELANPLRLAPAEQVSDETGRGEPDATPVPTPLGALLLDTAWDDLIADEAEVLRGSGTKQAAALWELRSRAEVAIPLTGTPINRSVDDLGRLISWARNDESLFHGVKLSTQFEFDTDEGLAQFLAAMGPVVFRRDSSEIADELPTIVPFVMKLKPNSAEKALANAARSELRRVYLELMAWLEQVADADPGNPEYVEAKEALKAARGAWLGGTTLARMASSDPAALVGSTSAGAALLAGQGLIEAATAVTGTKRAWVVADTARRVADGHKVLIFSEFATVARGVIEDLDGAGVRVGAVLGGGGKKRDEMIAAFQRGDLDVLVCTSSGERGLNLQQATTIVHYDLPWTPKGVIQRTGRAMRIKSVNKTLDVVFPLMEGTIEERVATLVVARAVEAMRALDVSRGVDASQTEMGQALGGLVDAISTTPGQSALMAMTQAIVA